MYEQIEKPKENKSSAVANNVGQKKNNAKQGFGLVDNRPEAVAQRKLQEKANNSSQVSQLRAFQNMANNSPRTKQTAQLQSKADNHSSQQQQPIQKKENNTGLPDNLKTGMENLSGMSLDDVKVHRNSDRPAQFQAHAYAQGTDIYLGPGQEKHLPHEAWHVVQQKQNRVKPTLQMKGNIHVNDDSSLEREADQMGSKSLQTYKGSEESYVSGSMDATPNNVVQRVIGDDQTNTYVVDKNTNTIYFATWKNKDKCYELQNIDDNGVPIGFLMQVAPDDDNYSAIDKEEEVAGKFDSFEDSKEYLDGKIKSYLELLQKQHKLQVVAQYPRVFVKGTDDDSQLNLKKLNKKEHEHGVDLTYRNHRDAMDIELDSFLPEEEHDTIEYRKRYEAMLKSSMSEKSGSTNDDKQKITSTGGFPITSSTVDLMSEYSNMHYKHKLKRPDHTSSTRAYEAEFLKRMKSDINPETMAALNLPPGSNAATEQETMLNTYGAALDANTPPKSNPIGKGKIYKIIYVHFKRTLEIINSELDEEKLKGDPNNFAMRTQAHIQNLEDKFLIGMKQNEKERAAKQDKPGPDWNTVSKMIDSAQELILELAKGSQLKNRLDLMFDGHTQKWLEVLGTVLGLYYKTIKRLLLSRVFVEEGTKDDILNLFTKLEQLLEAEIKINNQLSPLKSKKGRKKRARDLDKDETESQFTSRESQYGGEGEVNPKHIKSLEYSGVSAAQNYHMNFVAISGIGFNCYIRSILTGLHRSGYLQDEIEHAVSAISDHLASINLRVGSQMIDAGGLVAAEARRVILELYGVDVGVTIVTWNHDQRQFVHYVANNGAVQLTLFSTPGHFDLLE